MKTIESIISFLEDHIIECEPKDGCGRCDEARECVESLKHHLYQARETKKLYIVKYHGGEWEDAYYTVVFVTPDESTAKKYVEKFNCILKKWKEYYSQYEDDSRGYPWIKEEFADQHFCRWCSLQDITKCYYEEVELR